MMSSRIDTFINDLQLVYADQPWYGDGLLEKLDAVTAAEASQVVKNTGRSVAQLVAHMIAWRKYLIMKATTQPDYQVPQDSEKDWPKAESWPELLQQLATSQEELISLLSSRDDDWLDEIMPGSKYNFAFVLRGVIQHDIYHLGQIGLLLRMLREQS